MRSRWIGCVAVVVGCGIAGTSEGQRATAAQTQVASTKPVTTRPFLISKETTFFTGPVRADGTIDYVEAVNAQLSRGVTPENNAAVPLIDALHGGVADRPEHYARVRAKLGMPAAPPPEAVAGPVPGEPVGFDDALKGPWTAEKLPEVAKWLDAVGPRLDRYVEASRRSRYYLPLIRNNPRDTVVEVLLPHLNQMRGMSNGLKARAMLALGRDDVEGFRRDTLAVVRVARLASHAPTLIERLVAIGCEALALDAIQTAATGGWLSAADVERIRVDLRATTSAPLYEVFELGERTFMLEFLQIAAVRGVAEASKMFQVLADGGAKRDGAGGGDAPVPAADPGAKDWSAALRKANGWYDRHVEVGKHPTWRERKIAADVLMRDVAAVRARVEGWRGLFAPIEDRMLAVSLPAVARAYAVEAKLERDRMLTETVLALSSYRAKTGEYPAGLKELVPAYFAAEPIDPLTAEAPEYFREAGGYELRSFGENRRPDAGPKGDDKVLRAER